MKSLNFVLLCSLCLLTACGSPSSTTNSNIRDYNGTASVGDFLTISINSSSQTITYNNYTNGQSGTVPYTVNSDGSYSIADPNGNLLLAYEVPGTALMIEAANAGPQRNTAALITAVESVPASIDAFAGRSFNYIQFRTSSGGTEIGTSTVDGAGNIQHAGYWPYGIIDSDGPFNSGTFPAGSLVEDASGKFFTINESGGGQDHVFGTQSGLFVVDSNSGTILSAPKAATKAFDPGTAGTYKGIFYQKSGAQTGQNNSESGTPSEDQLTVVIAANGGVTITNSHGSMLASGTLAAIADTSYIYNGLSDPLYGVFTFRTTTANSQQDVFVMFQGNAVIFSSFQTGLPLQQNGVYNYFYGVGLK